MGEAATAASDRYALAVVAYELLTGTRPFEAEHFAAQARAHVEDPVPPASERARELSPAVDAVLERGLAKDPDDRWPTARGVRRRARAHAGRSRRTAPTRRARWPRPPRRRGAGTPPRGRDGAATTADAAPARARRRDATRAAALRRARDAARALGLRRAGAARSLADRAAGDQRRRRGRHHAGGATATAAKTAKPKATATATAKPKKTSTPTPSTDRDRDRPPPRPPTATATATATSHADRPGARPAAARRRCRPAATASWAAGDLPAALERPARRRSTPAAASTAVEPVRLRACTTTPPRWCAPAARARRSRCCSAPAALRQPERHGRGHC